jgi:prevent-host-death family protein
MREVQASEAKTQLLRLLDAVERGETILITRHGRPIARLTPETDLRQREIDSVVETIRVFGRRNGPIATDDILSARHEGHK